MSSLNLNHLFNKDLIKTKKLENGITVIAFKNALKPKVLVEIAYDVGSAQEDSSERGLAHLVEHMIFKGTDKLSETDILALAQKYGATFNAFTSYDSTCYFFETTKNDWPIFLEVMADCMQNAKFDKEHLASEVKAVIQELNLYEDNFERLMCQKAVSASFPANHPYHFPIIGFKEELANITSDKLKKFYDENYLPEKATLFIVGDIDLDEALDAAERNFAHIQKKDCVIAKNSQSVFPLVEESLDKITIAIKKQTQVGIVSYFWKTPGEKEGKSLELNVIASLLANNQDSILKKALVDEAKVAVSIGMYNWTLNNDGVSFLFVTPMPGKESECEALLKQKLEELHKNGFDQTKVENQKPELIRNEIFQTEILFAVVEKLKKAILTKNDIMAYFNLIKEIEGVTKESLNELFRSKFDCEAFNRILLQNLTEADMPAVQNNFILSKQNEAKILEKHIRTTQLEEPKFAKIVSGPKYLDLDFSVPTHHKVNGIDVLLQKKDALPTVNFTLKIKNSLLINSSKQKCFSALTTTLLQECAKGLTKEDNIEFFNSHGAVVSFAQGTIWATVLSNNLHPVIERVFFILKNQDFNQAELEKQKTIMLEQMKHSLNDANVLAMKKASQNAFKNTPEYSESIEQEIEEIKKVSLEDIKSFYKSTLHLSNLVYGFKGQFDEASLLDQLNKETSNLPKFEPSSTILPPLKPNTGRLPDEEIKLMRDQVVIALGSYSTISWEHQDLPYLIIANRVMFNSLGSRIYQIREKTGLFYGAFGSWIGHLNKYCSSQFVMTKVNKSSLYDAESKIFEALNEFIDKGITEDELLNAKINIQNFFLDFQYNSMTITWFVDMFDQNIPLNVYEKSWEIIKKTTVEEVNEAIKRNLTTKNFCKVVVGNI